MNPQLDAIRMRLDARDDTGQLQHPEPVRTTLIAVCNLLESLTEPASKPATWTVGTCAGCGGDLRLIVGGKVPLWRCEVCD